MFSGLSTECGVFPGFAVRVGVSDVFVNMKTKLTKQFAPVKDAVAEKPTLSKLLRSSLTLSSL